MKLTDEEQLARLVDRLARARVLRSGETPIYTALMKVYNPTHQVELGREPIVLEVTTGP